MVIVVAVGRQRERYLVFVVVVLIVATQADEQCQLVVTQIGEVGLQVVGVDEHLQVLVEAHVDEGLLIHGLRLVLLQVVDNHLQGLLIALHELGL